MVFIVDDEKNLQRLIQYNVEHAWRYGTMLFSRGEECLEQLSATIPDLIILDILMPGIGGIETLKRIKSMEPSVPVIMLSAQGNIELAAETIKLGAADYFTKPVDLERLRLSIQNTLYTTRLEQRVRQLQETIESSVHFDNIVSVSRKMKEALKLVEKVKNNDITVLITGESGTGKELIARAIHFNGDRREKPFIAINCAALPEKLLESELFGFEKGAFTGADKVKVGKFEAAGDGTIFLDEIGEMDIALQAKLLRAIQERTFERIGATQPISVKARIVAATNKNLKSEWEKGSFRRDLFFRLSSFPIHLPPLRDRTEDIALLANHFLKANLERLGKDIKGISTSAIQMLEAYHWPGNIRELQNAIEYATVITDTDYIICPDLPVSISGSVYLDEKETKEGATQVIPMEMVKLNAVKNALQSTNGNINETARLLEIGKSTLYDMIKKYNIPVP